MEQLAMLLAERMIALDPKAATRILWDAAKLYRAATCAEERRQLLDFQARVCALVGRPAVAVEDGSQAGDQGEDQAGALGTTEGRLGLLS